MKKNYYSIGLLALAGSIALIFSCQKEAELPGTQQNNQTVGAKKAGPATTDFNYESVIHWDYTNTDWENEGFPDCGGVEQSPINIVTSTAVHDVSLTDLVVSYGNSSALNELDNGHTLQVVNTNNNNVTVNGHTYHLLQFHFHAGSEHTFNGVQYPMEIHFVNQDPATNNITVVGVRVKNGAANSSMTKILANWPANEDVVVPTGLPVNLNKLMPSSKKYFTYPGSLTTPPCTEGLQWIVLKDPITMSSAQIQDFKTHYSGNFRPIQALNGRVVKSH